MILQPVFKDWWFFFKQLSRWGLWTVQFSRRVNAWALWLQFSQRPLLSLNSSTSTRWLRLLGDKQLSKWWVSSASLQAYTSLVDYFYSRIINLISKAKVILAASLLFKYWLKLFLINSNFKSPATNFRFNLRRTSMLPSSRGIFFQLLT